VKRRYKVKALKAAQFPSAAEKRFRRPAAALAIIALSVFCLRVCLAWTSPGFFSGDDVEIHEMSLGMLLHQAVRGFELWFGVRPKVTTELRALVEADLLKKK
jgi:hypothetical protein